VASIVGLLERTLETWMNAHPLATATERRNRRQNLALLALASALGLWLGTGAPSVSPVAPMGPPGVTAPASATAPIPAGP
jgi:hypothetical protein